MGIKGNILAAGAAVAVLAAVVNVGVSAYGIKSLTEQKTDAIVLSATDAVTETGESASSDGEVTEGEAQASLSTVRMNLSVKDDKVISNDSAFMVDDNYAVTVPSGASDISYSKSNGCIRFNVNGGEVYIVRSASDENAKNVSYVFDTDEDTAVYSEVLTLNDGNILNIVGEATNMGQQEAFKETITSICDSLTECEPGSITVCGIAFDKDCDIGIADEIIAVSKDGESVTLSNFSSTPKKAGFKTEASVGEISLLAGSYKDSNTGYMPYLLALDDGYLKIMCKGSDQLLAMMASEEDLAAEAEVVETEESADADSAEETEAESADSESAESAANEEANSESAESSSEVSKSETETEV